MSRFFKYFTLFSIIIFANGAFLVYIGALKITAPKNTPFPGPGYDPGNAIEDSLTDMAPDLNGNGSVHASAEPASGEAPIAPSGGNAASPVSNEPVEYDERYGEICPTDIHFKGSRSSPQILCRCPEGYVMDSDIIGGESCYGGAECPIIDAHCAPESQAEEPLPLAEPGKPTGWQQYGQKISIDTGDWKTYRTPAENTAYTTEEWNSFVMSDARTSFLFRHPSGWTIEDGLFLDENQQKIGEFSPGAIALKPGQTCFSGRQPGEYSELIFEGEFKTDNLYGVKHIEQAFFESDSPDGGVWYPHTYCLTDGSRAVVLSFYEFEWDSDLRKIFNKVAATVEFGD